MKHLMALLPLFAFGAFLALAADVTGTWKGTADTPNGPVERTFIFKVDGNKLSGETTSEMFGKSTITDGKIDGNDLSFTITAKYQDNEMKLTYKGKVNGNEIKFTVEIPGVDRPIVYNAKRVS